jgi:hypothetical protein
MKKSIILLSIAILLVAMQSCSTGRVGCPINATHGFGHGRI